MNWPRDPATYAQSAIIAEEVCNDMLTRLSLMTIKPQIITVMGSRVGFETGKLQEIYPDARIISIDPDLAFLEYATGNHSLCAQPDALPFAPQSVDVIFANLTMSFTPKNLLKEWQRILRPEGLLMFSALGSQSFTEWPAEVQNSLACHVCDMHDLGDALVTHSFSDPVLDSDFITLKYKSITTLKNELSATDILPEKISQELLAMIPLVVQFEIIYGHAWRGAVHIEQSPDDEGVVKFPLNFLRHMN